MRFKKLGFYNWDYTNEWEILLGKLFYETVDVIANIGFYVESGTCGQYEINDIVRFGMSPKEGLARFECPHWDRGGYRNFRGGVMRKS